MRERKKTDSLYQRRIYRNNTASSGLVCFQVSCGETDVSISADYDMSEQAFEFISKARADIKAYIRKNPVFLKSLKPISYDEKAPSVIKLMLKVSDMCGVGPMAAVAGAIAEEAGGKLLDKSEQIIIENGGDIFMRTKQPRRIRVYAGERSKFKDKIVIEAGPEQEPFGVCTSSAVVGHSLSFGKADAVTVISKSAALADSCATYLCNSVQKESDVEQAIEKGKSIKGITGILIIIKDTLCVWGGMKLVDM